MSMEISTEAAFIAHWLRLLGGSDHPGGAVRPRVRYVYGDCHDIASINNPNPPDTADCSGAHFWCFKRIGFLDNGAPLGGYGINYAASSVGLLNYAQKLDRDKPLSAGRTRVITVHEAAMQRGAQLIMKRGEGRNHIATSLGNGQMIHCCSSKHGVIIQLYTVYPVGPNGWTHGVYLFYEVP